MRRKNPLFEAPCQQSSVPLRRGDSPAAFSLRLRKSRRPVTGEWGGTLRLSFASPGLAPAWTPWRPRRHGRNRASGICGCSSVVWIRSIALLNFDTCSGMPRIFSPVLYLLSYLSGQRCRRSGDRLKKTANCDHSADAMIADWFARVNRRILVSDGLTRGRSRRAGFDDRFLVRRTPPAGGETLRRNSAL